MNKGSDYLASIKFASSGIPVLCQAISLRSLGGGQIDYCYLNNESLFVIEAKMGNHVSKNQVSRLKISARILSDSLEVSCAKTLFYSVKDGDAHGF